MSPLLGGIQGGIVAISFCVFFICPAFAQTAARSEELNYYKDEFNARYKYPIYDTLFEKIVWERKVSHLVMEIHGDEYRVTLLMMQEYPHNYKGQNYPIHFAFKTFSEAAQKFESMNRFLRSNGVMAVGLDGKRIIKERVLVSPSALSGTSPARGGGWEGDKILTREPLPQRLPIETRVEVESP